jgi:uncharacterized protein
MSKSAWHNLFWCKNEPRLRAGWRLLIQMTLLGWLLLLEIFSFAFLNTYFHWHVSDIGLLILSTLFQLIAFTLSLYIARRFLDHRLFLDLGLRDFSIGGEDYFRGIFVSFSIWLLVFFAMLELGWIYGTTLKLSEINIGQVAFYFLLFTVVGFQEELLCRGYILQTITSGSNIDWGILGSSLIFALMHLGNPGASPMAMLGIFCAGLLLAFAAIRTGQLWLSIGLHMGWNFFEAVVFGFPTSGVTIYSLMKIHLTGPVLWTGGTFGPEAGLIILPALAVGGFFVWLYAR